MSFYGAQRVARKDGKLAGRPPWEVGKRLQKKQKQQANREQLKFVLGRIKDLEGLITKREGIETDQALLMQKDVEITADLKTLSTKAKLPRDQQVILAKIAKLQQVLQTIPSRVDLDNALTTLREQQQKLTSEGRS